MTAHLGKFVALFLLVLCSFSIAAAQDHGGDGHGGSMVTGLPTAGPDVTIRFSATVGSVPAACGMVYSSVGTELSTISLNDYRFYVSNVRLINSAGEEVPVELTQDGLWQYENVALLDFEDGTSLCSDVGNADLNSKITGTVPEGEYNGLIFDLGIPFELNHLDTTTAPAPLNVPALWWNWQFGYKFVRIDMQTPNGETPAWFVHLGSTGCVSSDGNTPPSEPCSNPNVATVRFDSFDPVRNVVVADAAGLLGSVNLDASVPMPPGCMSGPDDTDCTGLFPGFGLDLASGTVATEAAQTFFRVEGTTAHEMMSHSHTDTMAASADMSDAEIIEHLSKAIFETPENPLTVEPIVVTGDYAVAGWTQSRRGGRAFWQKVDGEWTAVICSGVSLTDAGTYVELGVPASDADALVTAVIEAEAQLPAETVALLDSFEGTVNLRGTEVHSTHG